MKKRIAYGLVCVLVGTAALLFLNLDESFLNQRGQTHVSETGVLELGAEKSSSNVNDNILRDSEPNEIEQFRKPTEKPLSEDESSLVLDAEFKALTEHKTKSALEGNLEDAIFVAQYVNRCNSTLTNESDFLDMIGRYRNYPAEIWLIDDGLGVVQDLNSFQEFEAIQRQQFDECNSIRDVLSDDLHQEIINLADNGHKIARYIFALWPPAQDHSGVRVLERVEYEAKALEYSWLNVFEGEPLGLLAIGQANMSRSLFTPYRKHFGRAFLFAAKSCGLQLTWVDSFLAGLDVNIARIAKRASEEIVETFCI